MILSKTAMIFTPNSRPTKRIHGAQSKLQIWGPLYITDTAMCRLYLINFVDTVCGLPRKIFELILNFLLAECTTFQIAETDTACESDFSNLSQ